mmetsp:Transcript_3791/g.9255  ORF Transcript_3791/g.9255 Transcript_3791/m.9255 type:complete len:274 (-) Transcript_3791:1407-2228(-)
MREVPVEPAGASAPHARQNQNPPRDPVHRRSQSLRGCQKPYSCRYGPDATSAKHEPEPNRAATYAKHYQTHPLRRGERRQHSRCCPGRPLCHGGRRQRGRRRPRRPLHCGGRRHHSRHNPDRPRCRKRGRQHTRHDDAPSSQWSHRSQRRTCEGQHRRGERRPRRPPARSKLQPPRHHRPLGTHLPSPLPPARRRRSRRAPRRGAQPLLRRWGGRRNDDRLVLNDLCGALENLRLRGAGEFAIAPRVATMRATTPLPSPHATVRAKLPSLFIF